MLFCAFGFFFCPLCFIPPAPTPCPLALAVAFGSHSPCIRLAFPSRFPFAFPLHSAFIPCASLGVSGCREGVSGCRVGGVGSGGRVGVSALPLPLPPAKAHKLPPAPSPCPPPLPGGGKYLRLQLWKAAAASQSSDLRSRSALMRLLMYLPLFGNVDSQYSFSWSRRNDIIFWLVSPRFAYFLRVRSVFSSFIVFMRLMVNIGRKRLYNPFAPCQCTSEWFRCSYALE